MDCKFYTRHRKSFIKLCDLDVSKIGVIIGANKLIPDDLRIVKELLYLLFNEQRINNIFKLTKITSNPDIVSVPYNSVSVKKTQKEIKEISQNNFVVETVIKIIIKIFEDNNLYPHCVKELKIWISPKKTILKDLRKRSR